MDLEDLITGCMTHWLSDNLNLRDNSASKKFQKWRQSADIRAFWKLSISSISIYMLDNIVMLSEVKKSSSVHNFALQLYVATLAKWLANPTTVSTAAWIRCVVFLEMDDDCRWQLILAFMILKLKLFGPEVDKHFNCEVHSRFKSWCFIDTMKLWSLDPFLPPTFITQKTFRKSKWKRSLAAYRENASWTV